MAPEMKIREQTQDRAGATSAFSVFANEPGETLRARMNAAKELEDALAALPESKVNGPIREAMLTCRLAATHCQSHRDATDYFCKVSNLLQQADGDASGRETYNVDRRLCVSSARHYNSLLVKLLRDGASRVSQEAKNLRTCRKMWMLSARQT